MTAAEIAADPGRWQENRRQGVTATDLMIITGLAPPGWGSPFSLWVEKLTGQEMTGDSDETDRGLALEPYLDRRLAALRPDLDVSPGGLYAAAARPWLMATLDRMIPGGVVEYKTVHPTPEASAEWGEPGTADVPSRVKAQVYIQMHVAEADLAVIAVQFMLPWRTSLYEIRRTAEVDADTSYLIGRAQEFRDRQLHGDPPDPDASPASTWGLKTLYPPQEGLAAYVPRRLAEAYRRARWAKDAAQARETKALNAMLERSGPARRVLYRDRDTGTEHLVFYRDAHPQPVLDAKRLRAKHPRLAKRFTRTVPVDAIQPGRKWCRDERSTP